MFWWNPKKFEGRRILIKLHLKKKSNKKMNQKTKPNQNKTKQNINFLFLHTNIKTNQDDTDGKDGTSGI